MTVAGDAAVGDARGVKELGVGNPSQHQRTFWGMLGRGGALGDGSVHANNLLKTTLMIYKPLEVAVPQVQYNTRRVRLLEAIKP